MVAFMIDFAAIADPHLKCHGATLEKRRCPDQFVGVISEIERIGNFANRVPFSDRPSSLPCVILILESPHTSEFGACPGPAKGITGRKIVRHLLQVPGLQDKRDFGLLLVNAVQFQCSLGISTSIVRDSVFLETWARGGKVDFEERLGALFRDGDCVVNCCTRGNTGNTLAHLRSAVQDVLTTLLPAGTPVLRRNHPSFWHISGNRTREWAYSV